jgi:hypothetical protein
MSGTTESETTGSPVEVTVSVDGIELDEQQQSVVDVYEENIETFIKKNESYGGSFENSAKLESILRHGEVRHDELFDIISEQILVRGFYDKLSRFHQLQIQDNEDRVGEAVDDTLLDMGNYAIMLAAMRRKYNEHQLFFGMQSGDDVWDQEDIETFMDKYSNEGGEPVVTGLTEVEDE